MYSGLRWGLKPLIGFLVCSGTPFVLSWIRGSLGVDTVTPLSVVMLSNSVMVS
jgi:hypothetical protein